MFPRDEGREKSVFHRTCTTVRGTEHQCEKAAQPIRAELLFGVGVHKDKLENSHKKWFTA